MPDLKISQLTGGGAAQATDEYVVARSGTNVKITGANVAAAATSVGTLTSLTVSGTATAPANITSSGATTSIAIDNTNANGWGSNVRILTGGVLAGYFGTIGSLLGTTAQDLTVYATSGNGFRIYTNGNNERWRIDASGHLLAGADATYDIGASGATRPRDVFIARDLNVDGGTLYVDATNNRVGIGTTSPAAPLHVATTGSQLITVLESTSEIGWRFLRSGVGNLLFGRDSASRFAWVNGLDFSATSLMALTPSANLGLGTTSFGTSAAKVLAIGSGTEPSTGPADTVQFYSVDRSAGNTIPGIRCEGNGVTDAGITNTTVTHKIAMKVNGTVFYLLATTNAT